MHTNLRRITLIKKTDAVEKHLTVLGIDDFSVEELDEIIQILYSINQEHIAQRKELFTALNSRSQYNLK